MYNNYLIPANTKRGRLILGWFRPFDIILFGSGIFITLILLLVLDLESAFVALLAMAPALITGFLVLPIPNYHNMLNVLVEMYEFFTERRTYRWKGWCYKDEKVKRNQ